MSTIHMVEVTTLLTPNYGTMMYLHIVWNLRIKQLLLYDYIIYIIYIYIIYLLYLLLY